MLRRLFRRRPAEIAESPPLLPAVVAIPPAAAVPADPRRLEIYLGQIADLPEHDRAIIIGVLQGILDDEAAAERQINEP